MTSVGEVMAIGRNFEEAIQKAVRMISGGNLEGLDGITTMPEGAELDELIRVPTDRRLFAVQTALERGYTIEEVGAAPFYSACTSTNVHTDPPRHMSTRLSFILLHSTSEHFSPHHLFLTHLISHYSPSPSPSPTPSYDIR
jgi:hypothetical protein